MSFAPSIELRMKLEPARSFLEAGGRSLQPRTLQLPAPSFYRPAVMRASLELHPKSSMDGSARTLRSSPGFECTRLEERRCATRSRCAARARGVPVSYWAVMRGASKRTTNSGLCAPLQSSPQAPYRQSLIRSVGMKLERRASLSVDSKEDAASSSAGSSFTPTSNEGDQKKPGHARAFRAVKSDQKKWIIPTPYACVSAPGAMLAPFTMGPGEYIAFSLLVRR